MAKNSEVKVTYKVLNSEFNKGLREMSSQVTNLNKEFRLQSEQMRLSASETEKLEARLAKLNKEYDLAKQRTEYTAKALEQVRKATGENSKETQTWTNKLLDAKRNEEYLKNAITQTAQALEKEKQATSQAAQESEKRKKALADLKAEQEKLGDASEKVAAKYKLETAALGNNATESQKNKVRKKELGEQMRITAQEVTNLEKQLIIAKREYGSNSEEVRKLETQLLQAKGAYQEYANELAKATDHMGRFGQKAQALGGKLSGVGKSLTTGLTVPIVGGVGLAVKAASDFDSAFTGVMKTVDEVKDANGKVVISYDDLRKGIRNMAKELPVSTTEISAVAEAAGQLGIKTENVLGFTKTMIAMGKSTNLSSEEAATALAQLANITQMPQDKFENLGSAVVDLGNNMATTEADIINMSLRLAGTGHLVGLTEADITGLAAAMSSLGINAEAGGSSMSRVMQKINSSVVSGGEGLQAFAKVAGVSAEEFATMWKTKPTDAIAAFLKGLDGVKKSGGDVTATLKDLGINSTQEIDTLQRLAGAGDTVTDAVNRSNQAFKDNQALTNEANKRYQTFESKLQLVKNKLSDVGIELGGPFMDALSSALDALEPVFKMLGDMAEGFSKMDKGTQQTIIAIVAFLAALGPVITVIGNVVTAVGGIASLFGEGGALAVAWGWVSGVFWPALASFFTWLGGIVTAIGAWPIAIAAAIALIGGYIITHWDQVKQWFTDGWNWLVELFSGIGQWFGEKWQEVSTATEEVWNNVTQWLSETWQGIVDTASNIWNSIVEFFSNLWSGISETATNIWNGIVEFLSGLWQGIVNTATSIFTPIIEFFSGIWSGVSSTSSSIWNGISSFLSGLWGGISSTASSIFTGVSSFFSNTWNTISSTTSSIWSSTQSTVSGIWSTMSSTASSTFSSMSNTISSIWSGISGTTSRIWDGIKSTISNTIEGARSAVARGIDRIKSAFNFHVSWPHIPLPHFGISGKFSINPPSVPHFSISWYANGGIMMNPTLFGRSGNTLHVGGEAGPEAILPLTPKVLGGIGKGIAQTMQNITNSSYGDSHVTIYAEVASDYDVDRMIEKIDEGLGRRQEDIDRGRGS